MSRSVAPHRQALEDQILAILVDEAVPMRVGQITGRLGPQQSTVSCRCHCGHRHTRLTRPRTLWGSEITSLLVRLERKKLVQRIVVPRGPMNPTGAHWWRA